MVLAIVHDEDHVALVQVVAGFSPARHEATQKHLMPKSFLGR
jgi:hypothetical protein